jgi:hypothetical protein
MIIEKIRPSLEKRVAPPEVGIIFSPEELKIYSPKAEHMGMTIVIEAATKYQGLMHGAPLPVVPKNPFYGVPRPEFIRKPKLIDEPRTDQPEELGEELRKSERRKKELERTNDALLEYVSQVNRRLEAYQELERVIGVREGSRLCNFEATEGIVVRVLDDEVVVRYETPFGKLEQVYDRSQFFAKETIREGARIEARCFAWVRPHIPKGIDRFFTSVEVKRVEEAANKRRTGPSEI